MPAHIALLRAVNVGGRGRVAMKELREALTAIGLRDVVTLLQSGNVVFRGGASGAAALETRIARAVESRLGVRSEIFVRSAREWEGIVDRNPFPREAADDPGRMTLGLLAAAPPRAALLALRRSIRGRESIEVKGREAYIHYPDGQGQSRFTTAVIERGLGTRITVRNWNTVRKLLALAQAPGGGEAGSGVPR
jgi:uncharacterized protein (DUF1697 family)